MNYAGKDGLKLLKHLGINISERDGYLFEQEWPKDKQDNENLVNVTSYLYAAFLPAISNLTHEKFLEEYKSRTKDYETKLKVSGIQEKLKQGTPLDMIL